MKLIERYATACNLDIKNQDFMEHFYPLPFENFITIHSSSGMPSKNYPFFNEVIKLIKPYLDEKNIKIVQIGTKDEEKLNDCHNLLGQTTPFQANYVISKTLLHLGNDSVWMHRAGYLNKPIVELFGPTSIENHAPYIFNKEKSKFIVAHRWGRNPTFASQEPMSTIATIDPFLVAKSVLDILGINHNIKEKTIFITPNYKNVILEVVPNVGVAPSFNFELPLAIRMDIEHNEAVLANILQTGRKVTIVTSKKIDPRLLQTFAQNIIHYNHELIDEIDANYANFIKKIIKNTIFFTRSVDEKEITGLKEKYFDVINIEVIQGKTKETFLNESSHYLNLDKEKVRDIIKDKKVFFKTNKYILSGGKIYHSHSHRKNEISVDDKNNQIIDDLDFWLDLNHYHLYIENNE